MRLAIKFSFHIKWLIFVHICVKITIFLNLQPWKLLNNFLNSIKYFINSEYSMHIFWYTTFPLFNQSAHHKKTKWNRKYFSLCRAYFLSLVSSVICYLFMSSFHYALLSSWCCVYIWWYIYYWILIQYFYRPCIF